MVESGCGGGQRESVVAATRLVIVSNNKHLLGYKTYIPNIDWIRVDERHGVALTVTQIDQRVCTTRYKNISLLVVSK